MNIPEAKTLKDYMDAIDYMIETCDEDIDNLEQDRRYYVKMKRELARQFEEQLR